MIVVADGGDYVHSVEIGGYECAVDVVAVIADDAAADWPYRSEPSHRYWHRDSPRRRCHPARRLEFVHVA